MELEPKSHVRWWDSAILRIGSLPRNQFKIQNPGLGSRVGSGGGREGGISLYFSALGVQASLLAAAKTLACTPSSFVLPYQVPTQCLRPDQEGGRKDCAVSWLISQTCGPLSP